MAPPDPARPRPPYRFIGTLALFGAALLTGGTVLHPGHADPGSPTAAFAVWLAVFPTLTVLNLALGDWLRTLNPILRTFVLATIAVPIVISAVMPQPHRVRAHVLAKQQAEA
jgi:antibiotic biosynthesis monooxygenase (ABM) superfamily enzyme